MIGNKSLRSVITDVKRQFVFQPTMCRGLSTQVCIISHVEKHACELGLISGTPNGYQLKVEIPALLKFHPHLEVKGIPFDVLSDPGFYHVYNPHHVIYGHFCPYLWCDTSRNWWHMCREEMRCKAL